MTESFFLTKTTIRPERMIEVGGAPALERHEALRAFLLSRVGREAADLFAEPVLSRGNGAAPATVSWYATRGGDAAPLSSLDPDARADAEARLKRGLAALSEGLSDPDLGPLLGAALMQDSPDDVWVADGRPFLVNWGMAPVETHGANAARDRHYAETLGRFLPLAAAPALSAEEWKARGYASGPGATPAQDAASGAPASAAPVQPAAAPPVTPVSAPAGGSGGGGDLPPRGTPVAAPEPDRGPWRWRWIAPVALLVLFAAALVWALWPGSLLYPPRPQVSAIEDDRVAEAARAANRTLEERIAALRGAVEGAVCTPEGDLILPGGMTPDGRVPPPAGAAPGDRAEAAPGTPAPVSPEALAPQPPAQLVKPQAPGQEGDPVTLLDALEDGTALVLALGDKESGHGTGFFIAPDLLVTNYHVAAPAMNGGRLLVTSERMGEIHPAELLAASGPLEKEGADFALLRVSGVSAKPLEVARQEGSLKLRQVIAAGYPGFVLETDPGFQALLKGDAKSAPGLVVTDGIVNAEQKIGPKTDVVVHTAHISPGNSGGPLVDACGRVVGINTFIRNDEKSLNSLNFSLTSGDLEAFLKTNGQSVEMVSGPCQPEAAAAAPPKAAPEAAPETAPEAGGAGAAPAPKKE